MGERVRQATGSHRRTRQLRLLCILGLAFWLMACASLPEAPPEPEDDSPVTLQGQNGSLSPERSAAIVQALQSQDRGDDLLKEQLAAEQSLIPDSPPVLSNKLTLLQNGPATYRAMFAAINKARDHINLETYTFADDMIGKRFAQLLLKKQAEGVQVNIIYDGFGSITTPAEFFDKLHDGGVRVLEFNALNPIKKQKNWTINNRDHRKLMIVDGRTAFIGGVNIDESYSSNPFRQQRRAPGWRDTHLQIEGPAVAEFQKLFMENWNSQHGEALPERQYFPPLKAQGSEIVRAIGKPGDANSSPIYTLLLTAIQHAHREVYLTNAYFVPDEALLKALVDAAQRGVDVRLVLPSRSDSWPALYAGRSHYTRLLRAGVKIYERRTAVMHAKTVTIDGVWSTIGSTNLDWRSLLYNSEANAVVLGRDFATQMAAMFANDMNASDEITLEKWKQRSWLSHIKEWASHSFHRLL